MAYPTGSDLAAKLSAKGIIVSDVDDLTAIMLVAAKTWEMDTGFGPFLAAPTVSERTFGLRAADIQFLNAGIATLDGLIVSIDGSVQTIDTNFFAVRPAYDWPYTQILYGQLLDTNPGVISITARWGFETDLNAIARNAIISWGVAEYLTNFENSVSGVHGTPSRIKQAGVDIEFGDDSESWGKQSMSSYFRAVSLYQAPWKVYA